MIPTIISQLLAGKEAIKLGSLTPTRDFNYVKDTAAGFIAIAESDKTIGQEINIATQQEISIGDLAQEIISQVNPNAHIVCDEQRLRPERVRSTVCSAATQNQGADRLEAAVYIRAGNCRDDCMDSSAYGCI